MENVNQNIQESLKVLSHHAYCLLGRDDVVGTLLSTLNSLHRIATTANPDFFNRVYMTFTIDDARNLKNDAEMRPIGADERKIFVLRFDSITAEAQNALLKLLEEPPSYAIFFLIVPETNVLLSTVRSRLQIVDGGYGGAGNIDTKEADRFVKLSIKDRLEYIKQFVDDISEEKKPKREAVIFLDGIIAMLRSSYMNDEEIDTKLMGDKVDIIEKVLLARKYADDRAPSLKMLLEYVALNL